MADRPDWHAQTLIKGSHVGTLTPVAVDALGNLLALMQGSFGGAPKTIATDTNGVMLANLYAQDLAYLKVRPVYGKVQAVYETGKNCPNAAQTTLISIAGRGALVNSFIGRTAGVDIRNLAVRLVVDGVAIDMFTYGGLDSFGLLKVPGSIMQAVVYDSLHHSYWAMIGPGITFESSLLIAIYNTIGYDAIMEAYVFYALVP